MRIFVALAAALIAAPAYSSQPTGEMSYSGWQACEKCHEEITAGWKKTRHFGAFESLNKEDKGKNVTCIPCHTVGYGSMTGFMDIDITPGLAGVQCESCHGPGGEHVDSPKQTGIINPTPGVFVCRDCHTEEQDSAFDYNKMSATVHGGAKSKPPARRVNHGKVHDND